MSGSDPSVNRGNTGQQSGPSGSQGGTTGAGQPDECPGRPLEVVLASPDPEVVADLDEGDLLDVVAVEDPIRGVIARTLTGELVGAVTRDIVRLRTCMGRGFEFEAEVLRLAGGSVTIIVRPR